MKFATLGHIRFKDELVLIPKSWIKNNFIMSPEIFIGGSSGYISGLILSGQEMMSLPRINVQNNILNAAIHLQDNYNVELIQLGGLTTSVTSGGQWLIDQPDYQGYVNHGDSYTAAVCCKIIEKILDICNKEASELRLAIIGAYGIIGEALSKILTPKFNEVLLIGRDKKKLNKLKMKIHGNYRTTTELQTNTADVIITATSHPTALLNTTHLKKKAIVIDVSQPPNLTEEICSIRPDVIRVDGGYVDFISEYPLQIPVLPKGKIFACIAEVIMQALENDYTNHIGSIDIQYLEKTKKWADKYGFKINSLSSFGKSIHNLG